VPPPTRLIAPVLIVTSVLLPLEAPGQKVASVPEWMPDKDQVKNLAAAKDLGGYSIRPPKSFERQELPKQAPNSRMFAWAGARRQDGTRPSFTGTLYTPPAGQDPDRNLDQITNVFLEAIKRRHTDWRAEKPEDGIVNGLKFVRVRWKGTEQASGAEKEGILYIAKDGGTIIQLATQDVVPETKKALPLGEAALLTFKKK
jgi:hypothetical protein